MAALGVLSVKFIDGTSFLVGTGNGTIAHYIFNQDNKVNVINIKVVQVSKNELGGGINSISSHPNGQESLCATDKGLIYRVNN